MASAQFPDEHSETGEFQRQEDAFRNWIKADGSTEFPPEADRYHLYVSLACPWAHRTIITRRLKALQEVISVSVVDPIRDERGWRFTQGPQHGPDPVNDWDFLSEAYKACIPDYKGRVTVPVLWDKKTGQIVNNSEEDIQRMLDQEFPALASPEHRLYPEPLRAEIDRLSGIIYETVNNGVYRAGFATTQSAYDAAVHELFDTLDMLESRLGRSPFLLGPDIVETDINLYVTLIRFDPVYHGHFKCNLRRITDYPNLSRYLEDLFQMPEFGGTTNFDHIKRHYYVTHDEINPTQIVPAGPDLTFCNPLSTPDGAGIA